jgi:hypothetical protein
MNDSLLEHKFRKELESCMDDVSKLPPFQRTRIIKRVEEIER